MDGGECRKREICKWQNSKRRRRRRKWKSNKIYLCCLCVADICWWWIQKWQWTIFQKRVFYTTIPRINARKSFGFLMINTRGARFCGCGVLESWLMCTGGWSMGYVNDCYIHYEKAGRNLLCQAACDISCLSTEFQIIYRRKIKGWMYVTGYMH